MSENQRTIQKETSIKGTGLHTGAAVTLTFKPAEPNTGFVFQRIDLEGHPSIPAKAENVVNTARGTTIGKGEAIVNTVEHVLAALVGMDIDNCILEIDGPEVPILDGSAQPFVKILSESGTENQNVARDWFVVEEPIIYKNGGGVELMAVPSDAYQIDVMVDYDTKVLGSQNAHLEKVSDFKNEIADARTFSFLHELEPLLDHGLIKGGDLNNAIVYVDKDVSPDTVEKLKKAFHKDEVSVKENGILDNLDLHYPNEAARHKLLDVVGDLALAGKPIKGRIFAIKPGHASNVEFAKLLSKKIKEQAKKPNVPNIDLNSEPLHDVNGIMRLLPHRPPFLLVDKIFELSENHVVGTKSVTINEGFFDGHFPGAPVMPGVLQVEAMAQVGGILALSSVSDPENYLTYFLKMDGVKFKKKVVPGDTLIFRMTLIEPIRRGLVHMKGETYVRGELASEADMLAQIVKEKNK